MQISLKRIQPFTGGLRLLLQSVVSRGIFRLFDQGFHGGQILTGTQHAPDGLVDSRLHGLQRQLQTLVRGHRRHRHTAARVGKHTRLHRLLHVVEGHGQLIGARQYLDARGEIVILLTPLARQRRQAVPPEIPDHPVDALLDIACEGADHLTAGVGNCHGRSV